MLSFSSRSGKRQRYFGNGVKGGVGFVNPEVDEKGFSLAVARLNEINGVLGILVNRHLLARAIESAIGVVAIFAGERGVGDHVVGEVPFSKVGGGIACLLQKAGKERSLGAEPVGHPSLGIARNPGEMAIDMIAGGKCPVITAVRLGEQTPLATLKR